MGGITSNSISKLWDIGAVGGTSLYAAVVAMGYASEGPRYYFHFDSNHPVRSTERVIVGLGVHFVAVLLREIRAALNLLFEASAEVGDWFLNRSSEEVREKLRSRFM